MNKKYGWMIGALVIALLAVGVFGASTAYADELGPGGPSGKRGGPGGGCGLGGARLEAAADVLNMSTNDLSAALESGKTLGELADEAGVTMQAIKDALGDRPGGEGGGRGGGRGRRGLDGARLEAAADVLNMSTNDLSAALKDGKSLQELTDEAGVDMQTVRDAMSAVREASMRERIAQAVEAGTMTQEKAEWLLEGLDKGFLGGMGFGSGRGGRSQGEPGQGSPNQGGSFQPPGGPAPDVSF